MSILENLKGRDAPKTYAPAAPDIRKKLDALQGRLAPLQSQLSELALEAELGNADAARKFTTTSEEIARIKANVSQLTLAHTAAKARDEAEIVRQRASLHKAQLNAVRKHLDARDAAAEALATALKEAADQYKIIVERSRKAKEANPIGGEWPQGAISALQHIKPLVAAELYRLNPGNAMTSSPFPGAACEFDHQGQPDKIQPLADTVEANSRYIMGILTGKSAD